MPPFSSDPLRNQALLDGLLTSDDSASLEEADRLASLGTLVGGIAHEINNPITYVLANLADLSMLCAGLQEAIFGYRLRLRKALGEEALSAVPELEGKIEAAGGLQLLDELIPDAIEGAERIRDLVRDLLCFTRPTGRAVAPVNVHEVLDSTLRLVHRDLAQCGRLRRDYRATLAILADHMKLGQVFLNLITNAIHACKQVNAKCCEICIRTRDRGEGIEIEVEDSGVGIPEEIWPKVFLPFFSTKGARGGTGLGLFISREIIEQHRGILDFRPRPGGGTIFRISLPQGDV